MRVGSIGYATYQGLGVLLKDFYDQGIITDVTTVQHWKYINQHWYSGPLIPRGGSVHAEQLIGLDVMFFFETCFSFHVLNFCKSLRIPTILMPMYECTSDDIALHVDYISNPSLLDQRYFPQGQFIPVPVPNHITWKGRERARVFVHNAGHGGLNGRNGTRELLEAMRYVNSPIKLIVRSQEPISIPADPRIDLRIGTFETSTLYDEGDVFVFPEKFNGLSLPLQEAYASGMLVMACNRYPMNTWLPKEPLIPIAGTEILSNKLARPVQAALVSPETIAKTIDTWYDADISSYSNLGKMFREHYSWSYLRPAYKSLIEKVVEHAKTN